MGEGGLDVALKSFRTLRRTSDNCGLALQVYFYPLNGFLADLGCEV